MASHHGATELESNAADSVASTPRSIHHTNHDDTATITRVRLMCSFGGKILPRPHDNQLRYIGGDTRIVAVHRHATFPYLLSKLSKLCGTTNIGIKYQLPNEDLDALITVTTDEDVENMMEEYDRLALAHKSARLRLFLFTGDSDSRSSSISSLLDGSAKREHWFLDALNGGRGPGGPGLERVQSEVSSIVSDVPDYLFGLDNDDGSRDTKARPKNSMHENVPGSDPGSPNPVISSPFHSSSSTLAPPVSAPPSVPIIPDLPPVRTKLSNPGHVTEPVRESPVMNGMDAIGEHQPLVQIQSGYSNSPTIQYSSPQMQPVPVYYMPNPVGPGNVPVQSVQIGGGYVQSYPVRPSQVPPGYMHQASNLGQLYPPGARPIAIDPASGRVIADVGNQQMVYGVRNSAGMVAAYPGMVVSGREEIQGPGMEAKIRVSQGP